MRPPVAALALVAIMPFALAAGAGGPGSSEPSGLSHAVSAREREVRVPLVGIPRGRPARLVRLHSRTLRPVSRGIRLHGWQWGMDWSPDGRHLALGVGSGGRIQVIDVRRWRTRAVIRARRRGAFPVVAWIAPRRLIAFRFGSPSLRHEVIALDPFSGRVKWRAVVRGELAGEVVPTRDGVALLGLPSGRIGPARLIAVDGEGRVRETPLPGITGGTEPPPANVDSDEPFPVSPQRMPGLAVDVAAHRAYVIAAERPAIAEVDLASGATAMHELAVRRTALQRLESLIVGTAEAKGVTGPVRWLRMLGGGRLAVTGADHDDASRREPRRFGLWIIDPSDWTWRQADDSVDWVLPAAGGGLLAFDYRGGRIALFGPDGRRVWQWQRGRGVDAQAHGSLVYARARAAHRTYVLDARDGRTLATLPTAQPPFIVPDL
jgi:hypothetical protein